MKKIALLFASLLPSAVAQAETNVRFWMGSSADYSGFSDPGICRFIVTGSGRAAAIRLDGSVACWGGGGDCGGVGIYNPPAGLSGCVQVAIAKGHTVALRTDGSLVGWGCDWNGDRLPPADLGPCKRIAAGDNRRTVALRLNGTIREWGTDAFGSYGNIGPCREIAAGWAHTVALGEDGTVYATGNNGQPGGSYRGQSVVPADLGLCRAIAAGQWHSAAVRLDGQIVTWGIVNSEPVPSGPFVSASGGYEFTLGLREDGSVVMFGRCADVSCYVPSNLGACSSVAAGYVPYAIVGPSAQDADGDLIVDYIDNCPTVPNPSQADCDNDGIGDACVIASGDPDVNQNSIPDSCECLADLFVDSQVNGADLGALLSQWGAATATTVSDLNRDGQVNGADLGYLLANWGACTN
jgi:alpha-tubulin suppressor-like RCC1 family protein